MHCFSPGIDALLHEFHVLSLSVQAGAEHWAAPLFYVFDTDRACLLFVTDPATQHGQLLQQSGRAVVTVSGQAAQVAEIRGLQMRGAARRLAGAEADRAQAIYARRFPIPAHLRPVFWAFCPDGIKATDNRVRFGAKEIWPGAAEPA